MDNAKNKGSSHAILKGILTLANKWLATGVVDWERYAEVIADLRSDPNWKAANLEHLVYSGEEVVF